MLRREDILGPFQEKVGRPLLWVFVVLLFAALVTSLLALPLRIRIDYARKHEKDEGRIEIRYLFGWVHWHRELTGLRAQVTDEGPAVQARHTGPTLAGEKRGRTITTAQDVLRNIRHWPRWVRLMEQLLPIAKRVLRRMNVRSLRIHLTVGTGDRVTSGVACGATWAMLSVGAGALTQLCQFDGPPDLAVNGDFERPRFAADISCIATIRTGYVIGAVFRGLSVWRRRSMHGTPHSRTHGDSDVQHPGNG